MELFFSEKEIDEQILDQIIRPPRSGYTQHDLGPVQKNINGIQIQRTDFQVKNKNNQNIHASIYQPLELQSNQLIIYLHGNAGSRLEAAPMLNYFIPYGLSVLTFDFSGCGMSEGQYITLGCKEVDDLDAIMIWQNKNSEQAPFFRQVELRVLIKD
ncbi:hypothetical protein PPERSA_01697 [Pseudocohnilembus persalinus]|uniref:Serine aminopeptidase S33 domain-containing protein n=1 Tax=Pseudocohnilembus persalinus TaxID=266149 RepID=A0A0V0R1V2_PSEPJ|nr:hypothetical protein PPERSA_01697 [Pseudocohnilembus persalinus]|eukprot:KRX08152.1 hypothetical protein PPERSA_01697 [Pseudocohnilembus persalinus]